MTPVELCEGLGMRCCYTCRRNADNNEYVIAARTIRPAADPPSRCADWLPMPVVAADATHERL